MTNIKDILNHRIKGIITSISVVTVFLINTHALNAVPVIPNESIIEGHVLGYCVISASLLKIKPNQTLYGLRIMVTTTENVEGKPNFTKDEVGKIVEIYSKEKIGPNIFNLYIRARVVFRGDERGGLYWTEEVKIIQNK